MNLRFGTEVVVPGPRDAREVGKEQGPDGASHQGIRQGIQPHVNDLILFNEFAGIQKRLPVLVRIIIRRRQHLSQLPGREHRKHREKRRNHLREVFPVVREHRDEAVHVRIHDAAGLIKHHHGRRNRFRVALLGFNLRDGLLNHQRAVRYRLSDEGFQSVNHQGRKRPAPGTRKVMLEVFKGGLGVNGREAVTDGIQGSERERFEGIVFALCGHQRRNAVGNFRGAAPVRKEVDADGLLGKCRVEHHKSGTASQFLTGPLRFFHQIMVALGVDDEDGFFTKHRL